MEPKINLSDIILDALYPDESSEIPEEIFMMKILSNRQKYESVLDSMWKQYRQGNIGVIHKYHEMVSKIKCAGFIVLRNENTRKHKIHGGED